MPVFPRDKNSRVFGRHSQRMKSKLKIPTAVAIACLFISGCGRELKPWRVYYSGQIGSTVVYYRFTDSGGTLCSDSYATRADAEAAMEAEILGYQKNFARRVWREVP